MDDMNQNVHLEPVQETNPDLEGKLSAPSKLSLRSSQYVFPTNSGKAVVRFRTSEKVKNAKAKIGNYSIVDVKNSGNGELVCSFDTALLMPGKYKMDLSCEYADGSREVFPFALEISNALRPKLFSHRKKLQAAILFRLLRLRIQGL